jgi:hypothetical protein
LHTDIDARRFGRGQARQQLLDTVDHLDDVGARLLIDVEQDARLIVLEGSDGPIGRGSDRLAYVADPDRAAVAVRED